MSGSNGNGSERAGNAAPKRSPRKKRPADALLKEVIEKTAGLTTAIAKVLNVDPSTVLRWKKIPKVARMFEQVERDKLDLAESTLLQGMKKGNVAFTIFYLKCKGGWREKIDIDLPAQGKTVQEEVEFAKRIIQNAAGAELINRLLEIAAGRNAPGDGEIEPRGTGTIQ